MCSREQKRAEKLKVEPLVAAETQRAEGAEGGQFMWFRPGCNSLRPPPEENVLPTSCNYGAAFPLPTCLASSRVLLACESSRKHTSATKRLRSAINPSLSALLFFLAPPPVNLRSVLAVVDVYPCAALLALRCGNKHGALFASAARRDTGSQK